MSSRNSSIHAPLEIGYGYLTEWDLEDGPTCDITGFGSIDEDLATWDGEYLWFGREDIRYWFAQTPDRISAAAGDDRPVDDWPWFGRVAEGPIFPGGAYEGPPRPGDVDGQGNQSGLWGCSLYKWFRPFSGAEPPYYSWGMFLYLSYCYCYGQHGETGLARVNPDYPDKGPALLPATRATSPWSAEIWILAYGGAPTTHVAGDWTAAHAIDGPACPSCWGVPFWPSAWSPLSFPGFGERIESPDWRGSDSWVELIHDPDAEQHLYGTGADGPWGTMISQTGDPIGGKSSLRLAGQFNLHTAIPGGGDPFVAVDLGERPIPPGEV